MGTRMRTRRSLLWQASAIIAHWLPLDGRHLVIAVLALCAMAIGAFIY